MFEASGDGNSVKFLPYPDDDKSWVNLPHETLEEFGEYLIEALSLPLHSNLKFRWDRDNYCYAYTLGDDEKENQFIKRKDGHLTFGSIARSIVDQYHSKKAAGVYIYENKCDSENCICQYYPRTMMWGHRIYQRLLEIYLKLNSYSYSKLKDSNFWYNLTKNQYNLFSYFDKGGNDLNEAKQIVDPVHFLFMTCLNNYKVQFNLGQIELLDQKVLFDSMPFKECVRDEHSYEDKYAVWRSKSIIDIKPNNDSNISSFMGRLSAEHESPWFTTGKDRLMNEIYTKEGFPSSLFRDGTEPLAYVVESYCICGEMIYRACETFINRHGFQDYRIIDEIEEKWEAIQSIFLQFLKSGHAKIIAKLECNIQLNSTERSQKRQLRNKLENVEYFVDYWDDLEQYI